MQEPFKPSRLIHAQDDWDTSADFDSIDSKGGANNLMGISNSPLSKNGIIQKNAIINASKESLNKSSKSADTAAKKTNTVESLSEVLPFSLDDMEVLLSGYLGGIYR